MPPGSILDSVIAALSFRQYAAVGCYPTHVLFRVKLRWLLCRAEDSSLTLQYADFRVRGVVAPPNFYPLLDFINEALLSLTISDLPVAPCSALNELL